MSGPLTGLRIVEFAGLGPGPFACMLLSDMGADVVTIERPGQRLGDATRIVGRGRTAVCADLKQPGDVDAVRALLAVADVLVEGFRPGVMEKLGLGPDAVAQSNPRLVYGRVTGWGQHGPLAQAAGHDINYIAITGALDAIGPKDGPPAPPLNLVGDYAAGSLYLVNGILAALLERGHSGRGQVVDAAITDGAVSLMSLFVSQGSARPPQVSLAPAGGGLGAAPPRGRSPSLQGRFGAPRGGNELDGGAPYYRAYATADGRYVSIGPIEPRFFEELCERIGVPAPMRSAQHDRNRWPALAAELERIFKSRTQAAWCVLLEGTDACFAPVLPLAEAPGHSHHRARGTFVNVAGVEQPAPAPRFSRTPSAVQGPPPEAATPASEVLERWTARSPGEA